MYQRPFCDCLDGHVPDVTFHSDQQDTTADGWKRLLELIDQAAADGREEFVPRDDIPDLEWMQIVTLPPTIGTLTAVKRFVLYGSHLVRIPPEIGAMTSLEVFEPYTSDRLHWFPYEITRCTNLKDSTVSTRCVYGNFKYRPPFPQLQPGRAITHDLPLPALDPGVWGATAILTCSVCDQSLQDTGLYQAWISHWVGTDVLPLLINACSEACLAQVPAAAEHYVPTLHHGGPLVEQPSTARWIGRTGRYP
jgi:hypothetical protein